MPRPSKPAALLRVEGASHLSKAELDRREAAEKALQASGTFAELPAVSQDITAHTEFLRLKKLFADIAFVGALDTQIINRYCLEVSGLAAQRQRITDIRNDLENTDDLAERIKLYELQNRAQIALGKIEDRLLKLEDRLFLTPIARIKAIPKALPGNDKPLTGIAAYRACHKAVDPEEEKRKEMIERLFPDI